MEQKITTLTASEITILAFQEFILSGKDKITNKFTEEATTKIRQLRELIWICLTEKHPATNAILRQAEDNQKEGIDITIALLSLEMRDEKFNSKIQIIAQEINAGKLLNFANSKLKCNT
jgi:hypothetical protein